MKSQRSSEHEELQWFIDFVNMDLDTIKPGDRAKLLVESDILFPLKEIGLMDSLPMPGDPATAQWVEIDPSKISKENLWQLSKEDKRKMAWAFEIPGKETEEYWNNIVKLQEGVKEIFFQFCIAPFESAFRFSLRIMLRGDRGPKEPYTISYLPFTESQDEYLSFKILRLLDGLPGNAIRQCPGCGKIFLHTSLREKKFCTPRCLWKYNAAKRREKDPEGYKNYQRDLMHDRYLEKLGLPRKKTKARNKKKGD